MKLAVRISALSLVIAAAAFGNSFSKNPTVAAVHQGSLPGPIPTCNPFTEKCGNLR